MASSEPHPPAKFQLVSMYGLEVMSERDELWVGMAGGENNWVINWI